MLIRRECTLDVGSLRHQVTIQKRSEVPDAFGQPNITWLDVYTAWAGLSNLNSREQYTANQLQSQVTDVIMIRYTSTPITAGMRVKLLNRLYDVQAVIDPEQRHIILKLFVLETSNAG